MQESHRMSKSNVKSEYVCQRSEIRDVEMRNMRGVCGVKRVDGKSNESAHGKSDMSSIFKGEGVNCGVVGVVQHSTLR